MGTYITDADLLAAISENVVNATADDDNNGTPDAAVLALVIASAEGIVDSFLLGFYTFPLTEPTDRIVRFAALDFALAFLAERHPEYVRNRDSKMGEVRYKRGVETMLRLQQARQRLPDESLVAPPKNIGGIVYNCGPTFMVGSAAGNGCPDV